MTTTLDFKPVSDKQIAFLKVLLSERDVAADVVHGISEGIATGTLDGYSASDAIGMLKNLPKKGGPAKAVIKEVKEGFYTDGVEFFQVCVSRQGHMYAKQLVTREAKGLYVTKHKAEWRYATGAMKNYQTWESINLAHASSYGLKYGVCMICARVLTNPESIERGIGPICAGKF